MTQIIEKKTVAMKRAERTLRYAQIEIAARELLNKIDSMTSEEFQIGEERKEREALRIALNS